MNERKVGIDGVLTLKWELCMKGEFEYVKNIEGKEDIQILKKEEIINVLKGEKDIELIGKSMMKVTMDKPEIEEILKCSMNLHKKEIKLGEDKIYMGCYCKIEVLYVGKETKEVMILQDDVYLSKEEEMIGVDSSMLSVMTLDIENSECSVVTDDLGESRIVNLEFVIKGKVKVYSKERLELIKDAYSPTMAIELNTKSNEFGVIHGMNSMEIMVKDNIYLKDEKVKIDQVVSVSGASHITDKVVESDKVKIEGIIKTIVLYKSIGEDICYDVIVEDIPYATTLEVSGAKEGMDVIVKSSVENIDASIEANTIAVKANVSVWAKVCYKVDKQWIVDVIEGIEEIKEKKASVTIYIVGEGDTLWKLAKKYNTTVEELVNINDIENPDLLKVGEKLIIPGRAIF